MSGVWIDMKKSFRPHVPFKSQFNCITAAEKQVLLLKKMNQGKSQYDAEGELRKENGFIIRNEKRLLEEKKKFDEENKSKNAKDTFMDLIINENAKARRR
jgi:hypothetical protein